MERKVQRLQAADGTDRGLIPLVQILVAVFFLGFGMPADAYTAIEVERPGTIVGRAVFDGAPPELPEIPVRKDTGVCGDSSKSVPDVRIGDDGGLENAVVFLEDVERGRPVETVEPVLDQVECEFVPHVLFVPTGSTVRFRNSDGILHNIRTRSEKNPPFNRAQPGFKKVLEETFRKPEFVRVSCDAHEWMSAILVVHEHPYYAVTDGDGRFRIDGVPAGTYTLRAWHERLGDRSQEVTIDPDGTTRASFEWTRP